MYRTLHTIALATTFSLSTSAIASKPIEHELIDAIAQAIEENYVYPDKGASAARLLRDSITAGTYDNIQGEMLAGMISDAMVEHTEDLHFDVRVLPQGWTPPQSDDEAQQRQAPSAPYGFNSIKRLDGNIGYVELNGFNRADYIGDTVEAAMRLMQGSDALIFDLRRNGGGDPNAVALITSYLYDPSEPVHINSLYSRPDDKTTDYWTHANINTELAMPDVPVYVLTSNYTFSAAEEFSYNLRNLQRATLVGQTTGGGAHPVDSILFHSETTDRHYMVVLPSARAISPITGTNWEGVGVQPHLECDADDALDQALLDAYAKLLADGNDRVEFGLASLRARLSPVELESSQLAEFVGNYTDREIAINNGTLMYRRVGAKEYRPLICFEQDKFMIEGINGFFLHFQRDENSSIIAVNGRYEQGHTDKSVRVNENG
jgi:hypothetical protein